MTRRSRRLLAACCALALAQTGAAGATAAPRVRDVLPNLVALPPVALYVGGPADTVPSVTQQEVVWGCHPSEVANDTPTPQRCLRFETQVANLGAGPLELHYRADQIATTRGVVQRIKRSDGTYRDRAAGTYVVDPAHAHFHYTDFAVASLWRSDARGRRLGSSPLRVGRKAGFCLEDVYRYRGDVTKQYVPPLACYPNDVDGGVSQVNGVSPGWVDVYDLSVPHQYVEITGVADGYYLLEIALDPGRHVQETTTRDDTAVQRIRLCGNVVDVVGRSNRCGGGTAAAPLPPAFGGPSPHLAERLNYCALRP